LAYSERVGFEQHFDRDRRDTRTGAGRTSTATDHASLLSAIARLGYNGYAPASIAERSQASDATFGVTSTEIQPDDPRHVARLDGRPDDQDFSSNAANGGNGAGAHGLQLTFAATDAASALIPGDGIETEVLPVSLHDRSASASDLEPAFRSGEVSAAVLMAGRRPTEALGPSGRARMDSSELHAKAIIAAALIANRAVEIPSVPQTGHWSDDAVAVRLRDITDYVYQVLAARAPGGN
jgi:hypothetical protein